DGPAPDPHRSGAGPVLPGPPARTSRAVPPQPGRPPPAPAAPPAPPPPRTTPPAPPHTAPPATFGRFRAHPGDVMGPRRGKRSWRSETGRSETGRGETERGKTERVLPGSVQQRSRDQPG